MNTNKPLQNIYLDWAPSVIAVATLVAFATSIAFLLLGWSIIFQKSRRSTALSTVTTTMLLRSTTTERTFMLPEKARSELVKATLASFLAQWALVLSSCEEKATRSPSIHVRMERDEKCLVQRPKLPLPWRTWKPRLQELN